MVCTINYVSLHKLNVSYKLAKKLDGRSVVCLDKKEVEELYIAVCKLYGKNTRTTIEDNYYCSDCGCVLLYKQDKYGQN